MHPLCKLYLRVCRRFGPWYEGKRVTLSSYAWVVFQSTGRSFWRDRIDGWWLLRYGQRDHCQSTFQRERANHDAKGRAHECQ